MPSYHGSITQVYFCGAWPKQTLEPVPLCGVAGHAESCRCTTRKVTTEPDPTPSPLEVQTPRTIDL